MLGEHYEWAVDVADILKRMMLHVRRLVDPKEYTSDPLEELDLSREERERFDTLLDIARRQLESKTDIKS